MKLISRFVITLLLLGLLVGELLLGQYELRELLNYGWQDNESSRKAIVVLLGAGALFFLACRTALGIPFDFEKSYKIDHLFIVAELLCIPLLFVYLCYQQFGIWQQLEPRDTLKKVVAALWIAAASCWLIGHYKLVFQALRRGTGETATKDGFFKRLVGLRDIRGFGLRPISIARVVYKFTVDRNFGGITLCLVILNGVLNLFL